MSFYQRYGKQFFDRLCALGLLILLAPVMGVTALMVRLRLGRPVIFRQERPGLGAKPFVLYKFRTLSNARDDSGQLLEDALRLGTLGRSLRRLSLDELPELVNVLRGEMSLVGPRPLLMVYLSRYSERQMGRHRVLPGITGWAQIHGRNAVDWPERFELDLWYIDHMSFRLDLKILWRTLGLALSRQGVAAEGHATMPEFQGGEPPSE